MKAIETHYNGIFYRSRLEARWRFFFDSIGLPTEYEIVGFDLKEGLRYLPDFFLPTVSALIEIKPENISEKDELRLCQIIQYWRQSHQQLWILRGTPGSYSIQRSEWPDMQFIFAKCRRCSGVCLVDTMETAWGEIGKHTCQENERAPVYFYEKELTLAAHKRFDHYSVDKL